MSDDIKFVHVRPSYGHKGGMTLAYKPPLRKGDKMVWVAIAVCSKNDTFNKAIGRQLATDKFNRGHTVQVATRRDLGLGFQLQYAFRPLMQLSLGTQHEDNLF